MDLNRDLEENFDEFVGKFIEFKEPELSFSPLRERLEREIKKKKRFFYLKIAALIAFFTIFSISVFRFYVRTSYEKKIEENYMKVISTCSCSKNPFDGNDYIKNLDSSNPFLYEKAFIKEKKR